MPADDVSPDQVKADVWVYSCVQTRALANTSVNDSVHVVGSPENAGSGVAYGTGCF